MRVIRAPVCHCRLGASQAWALVYILGTGVQLTTESVQYHVIRNKGTEPPGTGEYNKGDFAGGHFECRACGAKLYECDPPSSPQDGDQTLHCSVVAGHSERACLGSAVFLSDVISRTRDEVVLSLQC